MVKVQLTCSSLHSTVSCSSPSICWPSPPPAPPWIPLRRESEVGPDTKQIIFKFLIIIIIIIINSMSDLSDPVKFVELTDISPETPGVKEY